MGPPGHQARILTANPGLLEDEAKCPSWRPPAPDQSLPFPSSRETGPKYVCAVGKEGFILALEQKYLFKVTLTSFPGEMCAEKLLQAHGPKRIPYLSF